MNKKIPTLVVIGAMLLPFMAEAQYGGITPEFTVHDATIIGEAIWKNLPEVLENAEMLEPEVERGTLMDQELSGDVFLEAALHVDDIDPYVKDHIIVVLDASSQTETRREASYEVSYEVQRAIEEIMENIELCNTVPEMIQTLQDAIDSHQYDMYEGFPEGLEVAIQFLQDGEDTIFNPDWLRETAISYWPREPAISSDIHARGIIGSTHKVLRDTTGVDVDEVCREASKSAVKGAVTGATTGGALGAVAGGVGALPGAATGAALGFIGGAASGVIENVGRQKRWW